MRVASFFSGIGGIDLGLENAGMEVAFQCEILTFGQQVLKMTFGETDRTSLPRRQSEPTCRHE